MHPDINLYIVRAKSGFHLQSVYLKYMLLSINNFNVKLFNVFIFHDKKNLVSL